VGLRRAVVFPELFLGLLVLALAAVWIAHIVAGTIHDVKHTNDTMTITGSARRPIASNLVEWTLTVDGRAATQVAAARDLHGASDAVVRFLRQAGLPPAAIAPQVVQSETIVTRVSKHVTRTTYSVSQDLQVTTPMIDVTQAASVRLGDLLERGIDVSAQPLQFISTNLETAKLRALADATAEARHRAEILVKGLGGKLGRMRASSLGVYQIVPRNSTDVSNYGIDDTSTRLKDVVATVNATFAVSR
jgi:hypothetical protein